MAGYPPSAWVKKGVNVMMRWLKLERSVILKMLIPAFGVDPAEAGKDNSTVCKLTINVVQFIRYNPEANTMKIADWVIANMIGARGATIAIDSTVLVLVFTIVLSNLVFSH